MYILAFGWLFGFLYIFAKVYELLTDRYFSRNKAFAFICIIGMAALVSQINPPTGWDLYRHYEEIDRMRVMGAEYAWTESRYSDYICITALFYLVSLTPWNELLVFVAILTELLLLERILEHYREKGLSAQTGSVCFFLFLVLSNIVLAISGIRNVLAVVLMGYAVWNYHCNAKKTFLFDIILAFVAVTIHPASGFIPLLYFISKIPTIPLASTCAMFIFPILMRVLEQYKDSPNKILSSAAGLFYIYSGPRSNVDMRLVAVSSVFIAMTIMMLVYRIYVLSKKDAYTKFSLVYCIGTIGMISRAIIYSRMLYGVNCIALSLLASETQIKGNEPYSQYHKWYKIISMVYCAGMLAYQGLELWGAITYYY